MKTSFRKVVMLLVCVFINLSLLFLINYIGKTWTVLRISDTLMLPTASFQGTIQSVCILSCFLMVFIDYKKGRILADITMFLVMLQNIATMLLTHTLNGIPGLFSSIISVFTVGVLARFYRKQAENSITDLITGLQNRRKFIEDAEAYVANRTPFYLANIAIKNFAKIADAYGLKAGDYILKIVSEKLSSSIDSSAILYRIVGSNFIIIFPGQKNPSELVEKIVSELNVEVVIPKNLSSSGNSECSCYPLLACGIAKFSGEDESYNKIFNNSDLALSLARRSSSQSVFVYDEKMQQEQDNRLEAEKLIIESLKNDYFYLVYQPQFEIATKKLRGFETLIRCKKPDGTIVSPAFYIPVAEKSNLILDIDDYVLMRAMKEFKPVLDQLKEKITISINVSAKNISKIDFAQKIEKIIDATQFPPDCLEIEITEYSLSESMQNTISNINQLRKRGVQIALDDFGTGYTSIAQVMNLPINLLKIDKSLIDDIENNQRNRDLVDSVIYMGHIMNCEVISEGVESENQLALLKEHKCDFVQGFVWGKPLPYDTAVEMCLSSDK
ncbi:MAG: bifunctional diguanylate cyclase/phosphodiesterase [Treponema sp.]|nr:bifunctional diguanylate cyclase/phosphodiesterase [Candidatus Treponema equifaecale]